MGTSISTNLAPFFHSINMFNSNSTMKTTPQVQKYTNPNPNFDPSTFIPHHQLNDSLCFHAISNFLMADDGSEENIYLKTHEVSKSTAINSSTEFSSSTSSAHSIKCRRQMKKYNMQEEFRFAFRTKSNLDFMDDGFKWRKYGKKMVKSSPNPRNYFKCSTEGCNVKKRVERERDDPSYVITTYEGVHNHESPTYVVYCTPQLSPLSHNPSM